MLMFCTLLSSGILYVEVSESFPMASIPQIRSRLAEVFPEKQADVLAHVVIEAHDDLVNRADFHALTGVVKELAESQKQTQAEMKELAEAQKQTQAEMKELAEAQKQTQAEMKELAEAQKQTQAEMKELAEAQKQTQAEMKELAEAQKQTQAEMKELAEAQKQTQAEMKELAESHKELAESHNELAEAQNELSWAMKDTRKQLGGLALSVGYGLEAYAMERIPKILARQLAFVEESSGPEQFDLGTDGQIDVDVVVRGTISGRPVVFLCETKTNITPQEIRDFLVVADRVRSEVGCDDVRLLYFAYRASPDARAAVQKLDAYLAFPHTILVRPAEAA